MRKTMLILLLLPLALAQQPAQPTPQGLSDDLGSSIEQQDSIWLDKAFFNNQFCNPQGSDMTSLFVPSMLVLLVISTAIIVVYLLGSLFDSPALSALAKQEGYEILLTVMIFIAFFSVSALIFDIVLVKNIAGVEGGFMGTAEQYSKTMVIKISKDVGALSFFNTLLYLYYSAPVRFGKAVHAGISFTLGPALRPLIDGIGVASNLLSVALGEWLANMSLLCFIKRVAVPIMLPIGLLLRSVPQLRGGGNALIAFAFALFIVYPMMLTLNNLAYEMRYGSVAGTSPIQTAVSYFIAEYGVLGGAAILIGVKMITGTFLGTLLIISGIMVFVNTMADIFYTVFVLSFFLGLLNIFVTLTLAKEIARFLGTEINVSAFVKLI